MHFLEQIEWHPQLITDGRKRRQIFGKAGAAITQPGIEKRASNPLVHPHALSHFFHIRPRRITDGRKVIDVRNLERKKTIGSVFDQFSTVDVGDQYRRHKGGIQFLHEGHRPRAIGSDDNTVGVQQVGDRRSFAQKLRVTDHIKINGRRIPTDGFRHLLPRPDRHRALVDDHFVSLDDRGNVTRHFFNIAQIHTAIGIRRRRHGNEHDIRKVHAFFGIGGELEPPARHRLLHDFLKTRLVNGNLASQQRLDFLRVAVHAHHMVPDLGETSARGESNVTGTNDGQFQEEKEAEADEKRMSPIRERKDDVNRP